VLLLAALGWLFRMAGDRDRSVHPRWARAVIEWLDPEPRGGMVLGVCVPKAPPPNPPSSTPE
jgi:hypothetical protein